MAKIDESKLDKIALDLFYEKYIAISDVKGSVISIGRITNAKFD